MAKINEKIKQSISTTMARTLNLKRALLDSKTKPLGLSRTKWQVLLWLKDQNPCSQKDLLAVMDIDAAHLARVLEQLEHDGHILRKRLANDRRALLINLTESCQTNLIPKLNKILNEDSEIILQGLTDDEIAQLSQMLNKLATNLQNYFDRQNINRLK